MPTPRRIVSLLASGTELVCALGAGDRLVGRSHECDTPEWARRLPSLRLLAEMLHPGRFAPRREGTAWRRWLG